MAHQNATGIKPATHCLCPQNYKITVNRAFKGHTEEFRQLGYYTMKTENKLMWWGKGAVLEYMLWLVSLPSPGSEAIILYIITNIGNDSKGQQGSLTLKSQFGSVTQKSKPMHLVKIFNRVASQGDPGLPGVNQKHVLKIRMF